MIRSGADLLPDDSMRGSKAQEAPCRKTRRLRAMKRMNHLGVGLSLDLNYMFTAVNALQ